MEQRVSTSTLSLTSKQWLNNSNPAGIANQNLTPAESNTTTESFFSPECSECKPKLIKTTNQNKGNILTSQSELEVNIRNWLQARKNAGDQVSAGWVVRVS